MQFWACLRRILSIEQRQALDELGAIEEEIEGPGGTGQRFIVTAARGGEDVWVEVRRHPPAVPVPAIIDDEETHGAVPVGSEATDGIDRRRWRIRRAGGSCECIGGSGGRETPRRMRRLRRQCRIR